MVLVMESFYATSFYFFFLGSNNPPCLFTSCNLGILMFCYSSLAFRRGLNMNMYILGGPFL
eukprot:Gb_33645 [translate_table: standard]